MVRDLPSLTIVCVDRPTGMVAGAVAVPDGVMPVGGTGTVAEPAAVGVDEGGPAVAWLGLEDGAEPPVPTPPGTQAARPVTAAARAISAGARRRGRKPLIVVMAR